jgi:hypothetical protein
MYFLIPEIQGFPKMCILPRFEKLFLLQFFPCDVMAPSAAWASPISGSRSNFKNSFGYFSSYIKKMCHEGQIGQSFSTIKGQTVEGWDVFMNSVGLFFMLGQRFLFLWFFCGGAKQLEQGERSNWIQRSGATRAGGAKRLEQGEQSN